MTSRQLLLAAFLIAFAVFVTTHFLPVPGGLKNLMATSGGQQILDQQPAFTSDAVYRRLDAFGEAGRDLYQRFTVTMDVVFPLSVLAFLVFLSRLSTERLESSQVLPILVMTVPFLWFASDMIENLMIFSILSRFPEQNEDLASNLGFVTLAKRFLLMAAVAVPSLLFVWKGAKRLHSR